jgi:hypothetical protein
MYTSLDFAFEISNSRLEGGLLQGYCLQRKKIFHFPEVLPIGRTSRPRICHTGTRGASIKKLKRRNTCCWILRAFFASVVYNNNQRRQTRK